MVFINMYLKGYQKNCTVEYYLDSKVLELRLKTNATGEV